MTSQMLSERRTKTLRDLASRAGKARTSDDACAFSAQALGDSGLDVPFALFYLLDSESQHARLVASAGIPPGTPGSAERVDLGRAGLSPWPIATVVRTGEAQEIEDAGSRLAGLEVGPYPELPRIAFVLPIMQPGSDAPAGAMVAGVSARLRMDEPYRGFYHLLATAVSAALANARAYEEERRKAEALAEIDRAKTAFFSNVSHEFRTR